MGIFYRRRSTPIEYRTENTTTTNNLIRQQFTMARRYPTSIISVFLFAALFLGSMAADNYDSSSNNDSTSSKYRNIYGSALQPCSSDGMALTGYTRSGYCIDRSDDSGSHHICIDLSSLGGGNYQNENFCTVTGQSDWCSSEDMPCHEDPDSYECSVTNWCVCQWAFASYVQKSGGCENIQTVVCDSINQEAVFAYEEMAYGWSSNRDKYKEALQCLAEKCGIAESTYLERSFRGSSPFKTAAWLMAGAGATTLVAYFYKKRASKTIHLNQDDKTADGKAGLNTEKIMC